MVNVTITDEARKQLEHAPLVIQQRAVNIFERLADWPNVSGTKPLRGNLKGNFRIRTGDYRIVFRVSADAKTVRVWKIGNRGGIYD